MTIFDQIKADLEAGTPGPWCVRDCDSMGDRCTHYFQEIWNDETDILVTTEVTRAHNDGGAANIRRIARVPQLERIALAAEGFADRFDTISQSIINGEPVDVQDLNATLVALVEFREACK